MKRLIIPLLILLSGYPMMAQHTAIVSIQQVMSLQKECWNRGDLEGFMSTYWNNDSLMFIGKSGVTRGWQKTLENYKKGYPDTATMGKLDFTIIQMEKLSRKHYAVTGQWHLSRSKGDLQGHFLLLFRKIGGKWLIIKDHSS